MHAEILHLTDCPNSAEAGARVRAAFDQEGHSGAEIEFRLLTSVDEAAVVPAVEDVIAAIHQRCDTGR